MSKGKIIDASDSEPENCGEMDLKNSKFKLLPRAATI